LLTSLLPGLRELRAPLAACYCWLIAFWILVEPYLQDSKHASGVIFSLYRLGRSLTPIGIGVVASVTAYILGSLSLALFAPLLRRLFNTAVSKETPRWSAFTPHAARAVRKMAEQAHESLQSHLALSETRVSEVLDNLPDVFSSQFTPMRKNASLPRFLRSLQSELASSGARFLARWTAPRGRLGSRSIFDERDPERLIDRLIQAIVEDLPRVMTSRLLGRDPDLYSAIDRDRAEVDFRLGLIPPALALSFALASRLKPEAAFVSVALGAILVIGLHWDALKQQRDANDLLVEALADGRVKAPSIEGVETKAIEISQRSAADERKSVAINATRAMAHAVTLTNLIASEPTRIYSARYAVQRAREKFESFKTTFPTRITERGEQTLAALEEVTTLWVAAWEQHSPSTDWATRTEKGRLDAIGLYEGFRTVMREELNRLNTDASLTLISQPILQKDEETTRRPSTTSP
jgi:hypothetical protein